MASDLIKFDKGFQGFVCIRFISGSANFIRKNELLLPYWVTKIKQICGSNHEHTEHFIFRLTVLLYHV